MVGIWPLLNFILVCSMLYYLNLLRLWRIYPPGPLPVFGVLWQLGFHFKNINLMKLAKQYGSVFTVWAGHLPLVVLSGYEAVKEGIVTHSEELVDRPHSPYVHTLTKGCDSGILCSNGHNWKKQRRFAVVTMRKLGLGRKVMERQVEEEAQQLVEIFACAKGQPFDPLTAISNSVSNVICAVSFGYRFSLEDENFQKLIEASDFGIKFGSTMLFLLYELFPWLMKHLPGPHKKALSLMELVISFTREEIEKHKEHRNLHEPNDFIDFYLLQREKSGEDCSPTSDEESLVVSLVEFFIAGQETMTATLQWALLLMLAYPDIQEKVYREMEDVFGSSHSISYQDRKKLPYTNAVIHEIQRVKYILYVGVARQSVKDTEVLGVHIPKGTIILPDLHSVLLDPKQWETPNKFNPHHFLDKDGHFMPREAFLPFGAGARVCLGEQLAKTEFFLFFTSLLRAFSFQLPEGVKKLNEEPVVGLLMHPHPYELCAVPRCNSS